MASAVTQSLFTKRGATEPDHAILAALLSACVGLFLFQWLLGSLAQAALVSCDVTRGKNVQSSFVVAVLFLTAAGGISVLRQGIKPLLFAFEAEP